MPDSANGECMSVGLLECMEPSGLISLLYSLLWNVCTYIPGATSAVRHKQEIPNTCSGTHKVRMPAKQALHCMGVWLEELMGRPLVLSSSMSRGDLQMVIAQLITVCVQQDLATAHIVSSYITL